MTVVPHRSILVIEDEPLLAMDVENSLSAAGFGVIGPAGTIAEALPLLRDRRPDLAILDLNLGGEMVFAIFGQLETAGTPFIILSGHSRKMVPERYRNRPFLQKPYVMSMLLRVIHDVLDGTTVTSGRRAC
jgi:DNA-binding response OmpR family regulator